MSSDAKAGQWPALHHGRHLNPFALRAFYAALTAAQVFNTDQSLLLLSSFITSYPAAIFPSPPHSFPLYTGLASLPTSVQSCSFSPLAELFIHHGCFFFSLSACWPTFFPQAGNLAHLLHRICMNDTKPFSGAPTSFCFESKL